jgi:hypothetical protein
MHYLEGVKPSNLQKIYLLSLPEVPCLALPPQLYFSAASLLCPDCSLFMFQTVKGSVSKFLKAVQGKCVSIADCIGSTSAG